MKQWTVRDAYDAIDAFAPFGSAMPHDHVGLLVGRMDRPVDTILTALDATPGVVEEAKQLGAQLLVTHHPVMLTPRNRLDESDPEAALVCAMIRADLSMIAAHTNLDIARGGVNQTLLERVGWPVTENNGLLWLGTLPPTRLCDLQEQVSRALDAPVLRYGPADRVVSRFGACCGSGGFAAADAAAQGAEVFLTGEIKHYVALDAVARGLSILAAGHRPTEICAADLLAKHLQSRADAVQSSVRVLVSKIDPFL